MRPPLDAIRCAGVVHDLEPIAVRRHGASGPTLVVLHGGPGAQGSATGLARMLSKRFEVLEPLQRRSGRVSLTVAQHVEDLAAVAPVPSAIIGHSWGAMLGLSFAARYPSAVSKLVLVGCGTYDEGARASLRAEIRRRLGVDGCRRVEEVESQLARETDAVLRDRALQELGVLQSRLDSYDPLPDFADPSEALPVDALGHTETWNDVLRLQREGIEPQAFAQIRASVLLVQGDYDPHPGAAIRQALQRYIPHLEYLELERCGHEPWRERYAHQTFAAAVGDWLLAPG